MPLRNSKPISAAQLGLIVEDAASEIYIFSASDFRFLLVNRGARDNLGFGLEELRKLAPWDLKPHLSEAQFREKVRPLLETGSGDMVFETVHRRKDGSLYDVSVHLQLLENDGERIFFAAIRDVTRENQLKRSLEDRERDLEAALAGREVLLQEVNHRVKNSLQLVMALLQLHAREATDDGLKFALAEARHRVSVVASIHQRLYMNGDYSMVDIGDFLAELVTATVRSMSRVDDIGIELELQSDVAIGMDRAVPLALVVSELLTNSLKYAFPDQRRGTVGVHLSSTETEITVTVVDDGVGYCVAESAETGTGLGSKIVHALTGQIRAKVETQTKAGGTHISIVLPRG
jgi:PAS domain S-box-containing protein